MNALLCPVLRHASRAQRRSPSWVTSLTPSTSARCYHTPKAARRPWGATSSSRTTATAFTGATSRTGSSSTAPVWGESSSAAKVRGFHVSAAARHMGINRPAPGTGLKVHFNDSDGNLIKTVEANEGDDILAIAHEYDVDLEGACEGSVACSTCHVILPEKYYDLLPEPDDDENDMLDMAFGLTDTSRLGCQVKMTKALDGVVCTLPAATRNMFVDGKKASH